MKSRRYSANGQASARSISALVGKRKSVTINGVNPANEHRYQVGLRLRLAVDEAMSRDGISKSELARRTGTTISKLNNWLRGDNYPDPMFVVRFCDLYGMTADWLYRDILPGLPTSLRRRIADGEAGPWQAFAAVPRRGQRKGKRAKT